MNRNKLTLAILTSLLILSGCNSVESTISAITVTKTDTKTDNNQAVYWQDLSVFTVNTEAPRATFIPYDTAAKISADDYASSSYYQLLNGDWKFNWSANPASFDPGMKKAQRHHTDIIKRDLVNVNIDFKQSGLGGDNSWGAPTWQKYRLNAQDYLYSFQLSPIDSAPSYKAAQTIAIGTHNEL